jgi:hypothetical protein
MKLFHFRKEPGRTWVRVKRLKAVILATAVALMAVPAVASATAARADVYSPSPTILRSWTQGQCLDSNYNGNVYSLPCNWGNYQNWQIVYAGRGLNLESVYYLQDAQTGLCLENNTGAFIFTAPCLNSTEQWWYANEYVDVHGHTVINFETYALNGCLDANVPNGVPYVYPTCYTGGYQDWKPGY